VLRVEVVDDTDFANPPYVLLVGKGVSAEPVGGGAAYYQPMTVSPGGGQLAQAAADSAAVSSTASVTLTAGATTISAITPAPPQNITARWDSPAHDTLILIFDTPVGCDCLLQLNSDLHDEWLTIHAVTGTGGREEFPYAVLENFGDLRAYFRVLYQD